MKKIIITTALSTALFVSNAFAGSHDIVSASKGMAIIKSMQMNDRIGVIVIPSGDGYICIGSRAACREIRAERRK